MKIVSLNNVTKTFKAAERTFTALKDISLEIEVGQKVAIVGRSGCGKSTLLNMITGIDHPTQGEVTVAGATLSGLSESALAAFRGKHIGIVFQFFQLIPILTIRENILLAMSLVGAIPPAAREARAEKLLSEVGILAHADKPPSALSGGEQQRAALARALANDPELLVADEPTGNLDSETARAIEALLAAQAEQGKTVLVVTHERALAARYERTITMADGRLEASTCAG